MVYKHQGVPLYQAEAHLFSYNGDMFQSVGTAVALCFATPACVVIRGRIIARRRGVPIRWSTCSVP